MAISDPLRSVVKSPRCDLADRRTLAKSTAWESVWTVSLWSLVLLLGETVGQCQGGAAGLDTG
jgi:hypothetical protein